MYLPKILDRRSCEKFIIIRYKNDIVSLKLKLPLICNIRRCKDCVRLTISVNPVPLKADSSAQLKILTQNLLAFGTPEVLDSAEIGSKPTKCGGVLLGTQKTCVDFVMRTKLTQLLTCEAVYDEHWPLHFFCFLDDSAARHCSCFCSCLFVPASSWTEESLQGL